MKFIRLKELIVKTGLSRVTIWRLERAGLFPQRRRIGRAAIAWLEDEVEEWMKSRAVGIGSSAEPFNGDTPAVQDLQLGTNRKE